MKENKKIIAIIVLLAFLSINILNVVEAYDIVDNEEKTESENTITEEAFPYDDLAFLEDDISIVVGGSYTLELSKDISEEYELNYISEDESIATVDENGIITGVATGITNINLDIIKNEESLYTLTANVTVEIENVLSINSTKIEIVKGKTSTLKVTLLNGYTGKYTFKSSNTSIAKVSSSGVITGVAKGNATITVTAENGDVVSCSVNVINAIKSTKVSLGYTHKGKTKANVYIRKKASTSSKKVLLVKKSKTVTITGKSGSFYKVKYKKRWNYIYRIYGKKIYQTN